MTTRTAYIEKIKTQLDELNASMTNLESRAHEARAEARATYHEEIAKLHHQSKLAVASTMLCWEWRGASGLVLPMVM